MTETKPVHVHAGDLYRALTNVVPFAEKDNPDRPAMNGIHFVVDREKVWVVATDSFAFAFDRAMLTAASPSSEERWSVTIPRDRLDVVLQALRGEAKHLDQEIVVLYDSAIELVRLATIVRYETLQGYPDFRKVIPEGEGTPIARITAGAFLLQKLVKVEGGKATAIRLFFHGTVNTIEAQVGQSFRAFLMPMRADTPRLLDVPPLVTPVLPTGLVPA